jgi:phosphoribosylglycinamide formyltransferase-1
MNIGVLASHEGTTLQSILDACRDGRIAARVAVVISNNSNAGALNRARQAGVPAIHLSSKTHPEPASLDAAILDALLGASVDLVFLAGYMKKVGLATLGAFAGRIVNTHPALLPRFGGHGMFGDRVFQAVLESGEDESGVSIHLVDSEYDTGPVVAQCKVPVLRGDSVDELRTRVRERERELVVDTLAGIASGQILLERLANKPLQPPSGAEGLGRS